MTSGRAIVVPVSPSELTDDQIRAFRDSLPQRYSDERYACEIALGMHDWGYGWTAARRQWVAYRINRIAGLMSILIVMAICARPVSADCGSERAAIKLGLDEEAKRIDTEPTDITIARLVALPRPGRTPQDRRSSDVERMVWRTEATVTGYKLEADGDFHIVIADESGNHMIIEIPDPECAASGSWGAEIREARAAFVTMLRKRGFPEPRKGKLHPTQIPVRASGLGFFDKIHGQDGVAKSGIELHPVLSIEALGAR